MFTLDTESGFRDVVFITGAYGLGETVVRMPRSPVNRKPSSTSVAWTM
ncbi:PEP/pyruvate-binding domain-containing protein [Acinetobacter baumannii]